MKILIAPTAFKGSFSPAEVARAIEAGVGRACFWSQQVETTLLPLADGGDGTIEAVHLAAGGIIREEQTLGPTSNPVLSRWLDLGDQALVELASACGIATLSASGLPLDPLGAHTYGLGQMIARCFEAGKRSINIAVGGSASTDGGMGALRALGVTFFDAAGNEFDPLGGASLPAIADCDLTGARWLTKEATLQVLTDIDNPLLGPRGAAAVFARQKGASDEQIARLESGLHHFAAILERAGDCRSRDLPGAGAAGGTAFGLACALGATLVSGFDWLSDLVKLEEQVRACDLVITGEGCFDSQSLSGKVAGRLAQLAERYDKPLWVVAAASKVEVDSGKQPNVLIVQPGSGTMCSAEDISHTVEESFLAFHNFSTLGP